MGEKRRLSLSGYPRRDRRCWFLHHWSDLHKTAEDMIMINNVHVGWEVIYTSWCLKCGIGRDERYTTSHLGNPDPIRHEW